MARPQLQPTDEHRKIVEFMAACGIPEEDIARLIGPKGIDAKTLRKHFRRELDTGQTKATVAVAQKLFQAAMGGHSASQMFWLKTRGGWREKDRSADASPRGSWDEPVNMEHVREKLRRLIQSRVQTAGTADGCAGDAPLHKPDSSGLLVSSENEV
jgi:hypothetical protein